MGARSPPIAKIANRTRIPTPKRRTPNSPRQRLVLPWCRLRCGRRPARAGYRFDQKATFTGEGWRGQPMLEAGVHWSQTGEFAVDLATGRIDAFSADRSVEKSYGPDREKEHIVTEVRLLLRRGL